MLQYTSGKRYILVKLSEPLPEKVIAVECYLPCSKKVTQIYQR